MQNNIGLIGYGEVGKIFCTGLKAKPGIESVSAWDLKFTDAALQKKEQDHAAQAGVAACRSMQAVCAQADWLISAVTASNTLAVAQEAAKFIKPGTLFLDLNSASPGTKQQAAALPARWPAARPTASARGCHRAGWTSSRPPPRNVRLRPR